MLEQHVKGNLTILEVGRILMKSLHHAIRGAHEK